ncbi:MAG: S41 family peptidase [bacterium]|nr:S41 family peptidase [bacterium]
MNQFLRRAFLPIIIVVSLTTGFFGGFLYERSREPVPILKNLVNKDVGQPGDLDFSLFWSVWDLLHERYVDRTELDTQKLLYSAIDGLVRGVGDPFTSFLEPKESEDFAREIQGSFGGVGIEIGIRDEILTVITPIVDTPAEKAGILAGDKIIKIGDKSTEGMGLDEAVNLIRGPKGTEVVLTMFREGLKEPREFKLIRSDIRIPTVKLEIKDGVAHLRLYVFNKNTDADFEKISKEILNSGAKGIVFDLRNNPGGLLDSAVNIAGYFLEPGSVVLNERFGNGSENVFKASGSARLKNLPVVVLINRGSASASEIVAGAMRDIRGVKLIGEKSFGKGSVQQVEDLRGGSSLKVTIAKWFTPSGASIDKNGIEPDIVVERTEEDIKAQKDPQLDRAINLLITN